MDWHLVPFLALLYLWVTSYLFISDMDFCSIWLDLDFLSSIVPISAMHVLQISRLILEWKAWTTMYATLGNPPPDSYMYTNWN